MSRNTRKDETMDANAVTTRMGRADTVNQLIRSHPATVEVFNRFGIDACCGGAATVGAAALRDGADPESLWSALHEVIGGAP